MQLTGENFIGGENSGKSSAGFQAINLVNNERLMPYFHEAAEHEVNTAIEIAEAAFRQYGQKSGNQRALFLETIADEIMALGDELINRAMQETGLPDDTFSLVHRVSHRVGVQMVSHPLIKAIGFTGSFVGGKAIFDVAVNRREPIPVYAEMGSTNPVFILPEALQNNPEGIAEGLTNSVSLGTGQFCTKPGLIVIEKNKVGLQFLKIVSEYFKERESGSMLTPGISSVYENGLTELMKQEGVTELAQGNSQKTPNSGMPYLLQVDSTRFLSNRLLEEEVFGPSALFIIAENSDDFQRIAEKLSGHLTATLFGTNQQLKRYTDLIRLLQRKAGRLIFNQFPTGVKVCHAMVHGGPFPSITDSRSTSVGTAATTRFTRPVSFQNFSDNQLPPELKNDNPLNIWRLTDGERTKWPFPICCLMVSGRRKMSNGNHSIIPFKKQLTKSSNMKPAKPYKTDLMVLFLIGCTYLMGCQSSDQDDYTIHTFKKIRLSSTFHAEGAGIGDINGNGHPDIVCGPYWYEGPEFQQQHTFYEPVEYDRERYSDNFVVKVADVNGNGLNDILVVGFPGQETRWYENPGSASGQWPVHLIHPEVGNEAPTFVDLTGDGNLDLVFVTDGYLGYATMDSSDPTRPWTFHAVSEQSGWYRFTHGLGVGDIDGDNDKDLVMAEGWWENLGKENMSSTPWEYHRVNFGRGEVDPERSPQLNFGRGGAQMLIYDVDEDGYNDVITSLNAHGWGLAWYRQIRDNGEIRFEKQQIMGELANENPYGIHFSEIHALDLADIDKNGISDFVTGKRWWAHGPDGADHHNDAAVLYWFELNRNTEKEIEFIPHLVDYDSGVGTQISTGDLTGNGYPDIAICNKKGGFVFLNTPQNVSENVWKFNRPKRLK